MHCESLFESFSQQNVKYFFRKGIKFVLSSSSSPQNDIHKIVYLHKMWNRENIKTRSNS